MNPINIELNKELVFSFINKEENEGYDNFNHIDIELKNQNLLVYKNDYLRPALENILNSFKMLLEGKLDFPKEIDFNKGILYYNELYIMSFDDNALSLDLDFPKSDPSDKVSWLLSTNAGYQTFLYSYKNDFYLEITKSYNCILDEDDNVDFDDLKSG